MSSPCEKCRPKPIQITTVFHLKYICAKTGKEKPSTLQYGIILSHPIIIIHTTQVNKIKINSKPAWKSLKRFMITPMPCKPVQSYKNLNREYTTVWYEIAIHRQGKQTPRMNRKCVLKSRSTPTSSHRPKKKLRHLHLTL